MSIRPLEPGCLAVIIAVRYAHLHTNVGKVVAVLQQDPDDGLWEIRGDVRGTPGTSENVWVEEWQLLRIDDHGEDADDYEVIREEWGITA